VCAVPVTSAEQDARVPFLLLTGFLGSGKTTVLNRLLRGEGRWLVLTPFSLGYREMLDIHRQHHRQAATPEDSEYFQLRGPPWLLLVPMTADVPRDLPSHELETPVENRQ